MQDEYVLLIPIGVICLISVYSKYNRIKSLTVSIIVLIMAFGITSGMIAEDILSVLRIDQNTVSLFLRTATHFLVAVSGIYVCREIVAGGRSLLSGVSQETTT